MAGTQGVEGLAELISAVRKIDKGAVAELRKEMREGIGREFVRDVQAKIDSVGAVASGRMRASVKPRVTGSTLEVRTTAKNRGYPYPSRIEFQNGGARAFMGPTDDKWNSSGKIDHEMERFMDWLEKEWQS